jgi:hypothetical protein
VIILTRDRDGTRLYAVAHNGVVLLTYPTLPQALDGLINLMEVLNDDR